MSNRVVVRGSLYFPASGSWLGPRHWAWTPAPPLGPGPQFAFTGSGPQFVFTGSSPQFVFAGPDPQLVYTDPGRNFAFTDPVS